MEHMNNLVRHIAVCLAALLLVYVGSYIALRCSFMYFGANRRMVHGEVVIKTWVYFGDGDNLATKTASLAYLPLIRAESTFLGVRNYD